MLDISVIIVSKSEIVYQNMCVLMLVNCTSNYKIFTHFKFSTFPWITLVLIFETRGSPLCHITFLVIIDFSRSPSYATVAQIWINPFGRVLGFDYFQSEWGNGLWIQFLISFQRMKYDINLWGTIGPILQFLILFPYRWTFWLSLWILVDRYCLTWSCFWSILKTWSSFRELPKIR